MIFEKMFLSYWFLYGNLHDFLEDLRDFRVCFAIFLPCLGVFKCCKFVALADFSLFWELEDVASRLGSKSSTS